MRRVRCRWGVLLCTALPVAPLCSQGTAHWRVDRHPVTVIGGATADVDHELLHVQGARRLPDARVAVVNGKPLELRIYSAQGKLVGRIGRHGNGPGEFSGETWLVDAARDTLLIYSVSNRRWIVYGTDGRLRHEWKSDPATAPPPGPTFYRHAFTAPVAVGFSVCTREIIERLPTLPEPALRTVLLDAAGRYWTQPLGSDTSWNVYSSAGSPLGQVALPNGLQVTQIGADFVVGLTHDADDVEQVVVYRFTAPAAARTPPATRCLARLDSLPHSSDIADRLTLLKVTVRNGETAMEAHFSDTKRYAGVGKVPLIDPPPGIQGWIIRSSGRGYWMTVFDAKSSAFCGVAVGDVLPPGWGDGWLHCGG